MIKSFSIFLTVLSSFTSVAQNTESIFLSGYDQDRTVDWDFMVSGGRNSGEWKTIPVPSNWEMQGFGTYRYWTDWSEPPASDSVGNYRYQFKVPSTWNNKKVKIIFGGVMTDALVKINGKSAGPIHQGGFYQFEYDISDLLNYGSTNLLEVEVHRFSSNTSVNLAERRADFWLFSGIYRPVWVEALPEAHIDRVAIDALHDGNFSVDVFLNGIESSDYFVTAQIQNLNGEPIGGEFEKTIKRNHEKVTLNTQVKGIQPWTAEFPNRYRVVIKLQKKKETVHELVEKFGFRSIEVREGDGVYVNNKKIQLRGANRHSFWPTSGRTTSKELSIGDVNLIKDMNMNAVRMSHYPPDKHFLEVTDSLGLYVINELTGWQDAYDSEVGKKLVRELILRDVNHPSVIFWANGNEGGWNYALDSEFSKWDPQSRTVLHPWENFNGINTTHYEVYDCCTGTFFHGNDLFMPTEFLHGLYDGGHGAGLEDWWNLMQRNPLAIGGFLWAFADEGIVRDDQNGTIDVAGNRAPDGIVGPFREKEGSLFTIKEIWSPIYIELNELDNLPVTFDGNFRMENRFDHTNLSQVNFTWKLAKFQTPRSGNAGHEVIKEGSASSPEIPPHGTGLLNIDLPDNWQGNDAFYLVAKDPHGREIYTWSWMIPTPGKTAEVILNTNKGKATGVEKDGSILLEANGTKVYINSQSGLLSSVTKNGTMIPLSQGPRLAHGEATVKEVTHRADGNDYIVEVNLEGNLKRIQWRMLPGGLLRLTYSLHHGGHADLPYIGVNFNYPEDEVTGMRWLGKGPYRVWKNRTKGVEFDVWEKDYNNTITGLSWDYPEFKGFHSNMYWATLETKGLPITMLFETEKMFLRMFTPQEPEGERFDPRTTHVDFPDGDISFLRGIAPIGTKFHTAQEHGPAGQLNSLPRHGGAITDSVTFIFGEDGSHEK